MKFLVKHVFYFVLVCTLAGCGFHLRGEVSLPPELHTFYLTGSSPYSSLITQMRRVLRSSDITLVDSQEKAPVTLFIQNDHLSWSQTTIGSSGSLRDYSVAYSVTYALLDPAGNVLVGPLSVSSSETITALGNELLDNSNKLKQAQRNLEQGVITKMIFQISSKNTVQKLSDAAKRHTQTQKKTKP